MYTTFFALLLVFVGKNHPVRFVATEEFANYSII